MAKEDIEDQDMGSDESMETTENEEQTESKRSENKHSAKHHKHATHKHAGHSAPEKAEKTAMCSSSCGANAWMIVSIVVFIAAVIFMVLWLTKGSAGNTDVSGVGADQIKVEMKDFIDNNLLQPGTTSTIDSVVDEGTVYKVIVSVNGQKITSYASKDGKVFFPSGLVLEEVKNATASQNAQAPKTDVPKTDKPVVEVFVMSYCPYGTQIEKGLLPVVDALGSKADIKIKFVDYIMHGQKESDENLMQYCIQQNYADKYYKYLQCFLNASDSKGCRASLGFDETKLSSCFTSADAQFGISKDYADKSTWKGSFPRFAMHEAENQAYDVQGSPTLVINGVQVSSARDPNSLKNAICAAFTTKPAECNVALATASPSAGFGYGTSASDSAAAGCGV